MAMYHPKFNPSVLYAKGHVPSLYIRYEPSGHDRQTIIKEEDDVNILIDHPLQIESAFPKRWIMNNGDVHEMLAIFHRYKQELKR